ncbi:hypothetical protein EHQ47_17180 [Leptospira bourretii]|uniref:hypothetical protein n=1 Tax=Leptospira bourretii TaxID=2484962 RepID=UPI0011045DE4|nr:hypothetical protein [Leptospira bourretii]TGL18568.1 hypothetical protein EHQ47_17180 [Leptospira bourretii]
MYDNHTSRYEKVTKNELEKCIIDTIFEVGKTKGIRKEDIKKNTDVGTDLGFESSDGLNFVIVLGTKIGKDIPNDMNLFVDDKNKKFNDVSQIVKIVEEFMENNKS